jgi:hypothetical protein
VLKNSERNLLKYTYLITNHYIVKWHINSMVVILNAVVLEAATTTSMASTDQKPSVWLTLPQASQHCEWKTTRYTCFILSQKVAHKHVVYRRSFWCDNNMTASKIYEALNPGILCNKIHHITKMFGRVVGRTQIVFGFVAISLWWFLCNNNSLHITSAGFWF